MIIKCNMHYSLLSSPSHQPWYNTQKPVPSPTPTSPKNLLQKEGVSPQSHLSFPPSAFSLSMSRGERREKKLNIEMRAASPSGKENTGCHCTQYIIIDGFSFLPCLPVPDSLPPVPLKATVFSHQHPCSREAM